MNKNLVKNNWLYFANDLFNLNVKNEESIGSIILKIAKELNIDDKNINMSDLKDKVLIQIEMMNQRNSNVEEVTINETIEEENTEFLNETIAPTQEVTIKYSELDNLRAQCKMYGVGYGEKHTVIDLTQLLNQIRPHVTPTMTLEEALKQIVPSVNNEVIDKKTGEENTEVLNETIVPTKEVTIKYSELDNLRAECKMYGVGYGEKHTVIDLTQLLNQIRPHVTPTMTLEEALKQIVPSDNNEVVDKKTEEENTEILNENNFELTIENIDVVKDIAPSSSTINNSSNTTSIQLDVKQIAVPISSIKNSLETYRAIFTETIRGHFRPQTISEIESLFTHDYPFKYRIMMNPKNRLQVEMKFIMNDIEVRVPSDNPNDWFDIRD